jgi:methylthioribose-1-phosphate isomerase
VPVVPFRWRGSRLEVLEQRDLPARVRWISCRTVDDVARAIRDMSIRGAPAIGCAAAFGLALAARAPGGARPRPPGKSPPPPRRHPPHRRQPFRALERMARVWKTDPRLPARLEKEAVAIAAEDRAACRRIGDFGARLLPKNAVVLTHCNAGALATAGYGTALGIVRSAHARGKIRNVFVDETRPYLQGARLTAWELAREGIPHEVITDNAAAHILKTEKVDAVIVGADRIAANGDTANKIGTYALALAARRHGVSFYVAAPTSTLDPSTRTGDGIPIEERPRRRCFSSPAAASPPPGARARHPAFDVTPADLLTAIVTERGFTARRSDLSKIPRL